MTLRTLSRTSAALALVLALAGGIVYAIAPSAVALEQDRVVVKPDTTQKVEYSFLIGNNVVTNLDASTAIDEDICGAQTSCDVIPLTVPDPGHEDDFFLSITLNWETEEIPGVPLLGDYSVNDLDMYVQNDPVVRRAGPDEDGFTYKSAGSSEPEFVQMYRPIGDWNIFVNNASGVNTGYTLTFEWRTDPLPTIFESLPPEFAPAGPAARPAPPKPAPAPAPAAAPVDVVDDVPAASIAPPPAPSSGPVDLSLGAPAAPDKAFASGFGDARSLDEELAGPPVQQFEEAAVVKPAAPSTGALLLWLLALPLALIAVAAAVLNRRRSALLQL